MFTTLLPIILDQSMRVLYAFQGTWLWNNYFSWFGLSACERERLFVLCGFSLAVEGLPQLSSPSLQSARCEGAQQPMFNLWTNWFKRIAQAWLKTISKRNGHQLDYYNPQTEELHKNIIALLFLLWMLMEKIITGFVVFLIAAKCSSHWLVYIVFFFMLFHLIALRG